MTPFQFHARPSILHATPQAAAKLTQAILAAHDEIKFGFYSGYTWPTSNLPRRRDRYSFGATQGVGYEDFVKVWISVEILEPLLRVDLSGHEK